MHLLQPATAGGRAAAAAVYGTRSFPCRGSWLGACPSGAGSLFDRQPLRARGCGPFSGLGHATARDVGGDAFRSFHTKVLRSITLHYSG